MDILKKDQIFLVEKFKNKKEALHFISQEAFKLQICINSNVLFKDFLKREREGITGMENYIAIPHAISESITKSALIILCVREEIKWKTLDNLNKVKFIIALLVPKNDWNKKHLTFLSQTSQKLLDDKTVETLNSYDQENIYKVFS